MTDPVPTLDYQPSQPRPWRHRRVAAFTFTVLLGLGLAVSVLLPSTNRTINCGNRGKCASNLRQIGLAILLYQQDYGGQYPDTLGRLAETEQIESECFVCPSTDAPSSARSTTRAVVADIDAGVGGHHCSYIYVGPGMTDKTVTAATVVCFEPLGNHDGDGGHVLFGDGHTDWETKAELARATATTRPAR